MKGSPRKKTRAWGMPGAQCPRSLVCDKNKHTSVVTTGSAEITRHSRTQWFYGLFRALPGDEFVLSPSSADMAFLRPVGRPRLGEFNTSSGCQNHTALPYAESICRLRAVDRSRDPALRYVTRPTLPRPPHPAPRSCRRASRPSLWRG